LGTRTIPCIFGEEGRIERLWCVFYVFKRGEKLGIHPGKEQGA